MKKGDKVEMADGSVCTIDGIGHDGWVVMQEPGVLGYPLQVPVSALKWHAPGWFKEKEGDEG